MHAYALRPRATLLCCALLSACASTTPDWDRRFGDSTRVAFSQQVLHPDAARSAAPVAGVDGGAAVAAYARYQKSFSNPEPQPSVFTIGVSGK